MSDVGDEFGDFEIEDAVSAGDPAPEDVNWGEVQTLQDKIDELYVLYPDTSSEEFQAAAAIFATQLGGA